MRLLALIAAITIVGGGCGGGGDEEDQDGGDNRDAGLPRAELVRRADAICSQARRDITRQIPRGVPAKVGALAAASVSDETAPKYLKQLEGLRPRAADVKQWQAYLGAERQVMRINRAAISESQSGDAFLARLAKARGPSAESEAAAAGLGLKACTNGPNTHVASSSSGSRANDPVEDGTYLPRTDVNAKIPEGWAPKRSTERATTAFASEDDDLYCAFGKTRFGKPPGDGSPAALLKYARSQSDFVKGKSQSYRLISIQRERALNGTGVGISRRVDGRGEHIAFFYLPPHRYVVLCATRTPADFTKHDRETFQPVIRSLSLPDPD